MSSAFIPNHVSAAAASAPASASVSSSTTTTTTLPITNPLPNSDAPGSTSKSSSSFSSLHIIPKNSLSNIFFSQANSTFLRIPSSPRTTKTPSLDVQLHPSFATDDLFPSAPPALGGPGKILLWFRSDLRIHDHPALDAALEDTGLAGAAANSADSDIVKHRSDAIVPVYCFNPVHFGATKFGFQKTGRYRAKFLCESVQALRNNLQKKGSNLIVRLGDPEKELLDLCKATGCTKVYCHKEVTFEEQQIEASIQKTLEKQGIIFKTFWTNTLYHDVDLPFQVADMPDVYSEFRESVLVGAKINNPLQTPQSLPKISPKIEIGDIPTLEQLGIKPTTPSPSSSSSTTTKTNLASLQKGTSDDCFCGGEVEALKRLDQYILESKNASAASALPVTDNVSPKDREISYLGADFSCRISPWLALGCISPRTIYQELQKALGAPVTTPQTSTIPALKVSKPKINTNSHNPLSKSTTYYELVWRDFFRFITLKYGAARLNKDGVKTQATTKSSQLLAAASR